MLWSTCGSQMLWSWFSTLKFFKKILFIMCMDILLTCMSVNHTRVMPMEAKGEHPIPKNWSYSCKPSCRWQELNPGTLEEQPALLIIGPPLQLLLSYLYMGSGNQTQIPSTTDPSHSPYPPPCFQTGWPYSPDLPPICYVVRVGLEFLIFLPIPTSCYIYKHVLPCLANVSIA